MSLEQELAGVTANVDPSPEIDTVDDSTETEVVADNDGDEAGDDAAPEGDETPGRPVENVRRELLRKQDESERRIRAEIAQIGDLVRSVLGAAQTSKKPAQTFDDYSLDELRGMRGQVPEAQLAQFDAMLAERTIKETVRTQVTQLTEAEKYQRERDRANTMAVEKYPQLKDVTSALHREVNRRLLSTDKNVIKYNSRIVLNLAEEAARELGIAPRSVSRARNVAKPDSLSGTKPTKSGPAPSVLGSEEETLAIARRLSTGKIKFDDAAMKRIKERGVLYKADPRFMEKE